MTLSESYLPDAPDLFTTDLFTKDLLAAAKVAVRSLPYSLMIRLLLLAVGFMPVTLIAISCWGVPLKNLAVWLMLPSVIAVALLAVLRRWVRRLVFAALAAGPVATLLYDSFRSCFNASGLINRDPIPHIGLALGMHGHTWGMHWGWLCGYTWRYMLNGTGLALAFCALGLRGVRAGVAYGLFVVSGLVVVLVISPYGQQNLWQITPWTITMGVGGHIIYGGVLGTIRARMTAPPGPITPDNDHRRSVVRQRWPWSSATPSTPEPWPVFDLDYGPGVRGRTAEAAQGLRAMDRTQRQTQADSSAADEDRPTASPQLPPRDPGSVRGPGSAVAGPGRRNGRA
jgi:hypothetical protein